MTSNVFVILLNFNGGQNTLDCLKSIKQLSTDNYQQTTILVDNDSSDGSVDAIRNHYPKLKIIQNAQNLGFAEGMNVGVKEALKQSADFILLLNNDTTVDSKLIQELLAVAKLNENVGIVSPKIYFAKGFEFHRDQYTKDQLGKVIWYGGGKMDWGNVLASHIGVDEVDQGQYDEVIQLDFASGCAMFVRKEVFEKIDLFDKKYFLYYEDNDFSARAKNAGFAILYAPKAVLWHKNAGSAGGSGSTLQDYYITRNRMLFGMKYAPLRSKIALSKESIMLLHTGRVWQKRGIMDFYLQKFGKGSYE